ncbi:archaeal heat shock protein Hsp14 [Haloferax sp. S1W]|uniref:archaeal heat shock protein Hsp14 n=1 Tax=Haloferax sp. S1W TaxID=3377110 RepID=UPI0037C8E0AA
MQRNPFDEIEELFERMSRSFEETGLARMEKISLDVVEADGDIEVVADLPGYEKDDIDVTVRGRQLTISAEHAESTDVDEEHYVRRERRHRSVSRSVTLPAEVKRDEVSATYRNGVLTVSLPKLEAEPDDSRHIDIE